jgi:hypothetical protein
MIDIISSHLYSLVAQCCGEEVFWRLRGSLTLGSAQSVGFVCRDSVRGFTWNEDQIKMSGTKIQR